MIDGKDNFWYEKTKSSYEILREIDFDINSTNEAETDKDISDASNVDNLENK